VKAKRTKVVSVEQLEDFSDEYVYDVGMCNSEHNWFFGNNILLKNTDSVRKDTLIETSMGELDIESLFEECSIKWENHGKEYAADERLKVPSYENGSVLWKVPDYIYRHRTKKNMFQIITASGNNVFVTEDHSCMTVCENGHMVEKKPHSLQTGENVIIYRDTKPVMEQIADVVHTGEIDDYVYDIGVDEDTPYFFANGILVHNSSYFSVYEAYMASGDEEKQSMAKAMFDDRDLAVQIYDSISEKTNESFPSFMNERFNTGIDNGTIIKAGRENLASHSLFIKKKRYAMNLFDKDGIRLDKNGKSGKLKIMGLQIKRSDTPKMIQDALKEGMDMLLNGVPENEVITYFTEFKDELSQKSPWILGRPSGANAVKHYTDLHYKYVNGEISKKPTIPGAIAGAITWNEQLDINNEEHIERIGDQSKVVTCKLRKNDFGYTNISYLTDQTQFPDWFKEMPFDTELMLETIYYKPLLTIFGVLGWDVNLIRKGTKFKDMFIMDDDDEEFF